MAGELENDRIDAGQGDSTLIIGRNGDNGAKKYWDVGGEHLP